MTSAQDAMRTVNCDWPLCDQEAETGSTRCRVHGGRKPSDPMERLKRMYGDDPDHRPAGPSYAAIWMRKKRAREDAA